MRLPLPLSPFSLPPSLPPSLPLTVWVSEARTGKRRQRSAQQQQQQQQQPSSLSSSWPGDLPFNRFNFSRIFSLTWAHRVCLPTARKLAQVSDAGTGLPEVQ